MNKAEIIRELEILKEELECAIQNEDERDIIRIIDARKALKGEIKFKKLKK